ncbi:MAG TPA: malto-oligosyltrehalose synthase [Gemmatimonadales bacterium]|nr:malto-oligosyltrehalose synthase [Gemmatimonadales bacterium]
MTRAPGPSRILATYRLQLQADFPLAAATALVDYLDRLGVTHIHASPILHARAGSAHGYDVVDPGALDPELGAEADLESLVAALHDRAMGLVLDIVPNHMAASSENWRWEHVLAHGPASPYARWFDIEWRVGERALHSRVLLPVLGDLRARVIERGELRVALRGGELRLTYFEHSFPLDPSTFPLVLEPALEACEAELGPANRGTIELAAIIALLRRLPRRTARGSRARARRRRQSGEGLRRLRKLCALVPEVRRRIERAAARMGLGDEGGARMVRLLEAQGYRLVYWRRAAREINYRRFFDVNDLVALHMEDPQVFTQTHALVLDWRRSGYVDGFRIDHPDGLLDPLGYLERLAAHAFPDYGPGHPPIFVEKILSPGERLRDNWPVAGTTGYRNLNELEALFLDADGAAQIERDYRRVVRRHASFTAVAHEAKRHVLESGLSAGVRRLAQRLHRLAAIARPLGRVPVHELTRAVVDTIVYLPVYRTYIDERHPVPAGEDLALLEQALAAARARGRASAAAFAVLAGALLATEPAMRTPEHEGLRRRFVQRFQQVSGPAAAKGVEDTAFYEYVPLLSRNEVGGDPDSPVAGAAAALHAANLHHAHCWPGTMNVATTHDTKRSADVRARLDVLTEIAEEWEECVYRWRRWNRPLRAMGAGQLLPDANTEWLLYQTLVGAWPLELLPPVPHGFDAVATPDPRALAEFRGRIADYARKAAREAKTHTSWVEPDPEYEAALDRYIEGMLSPSRSDQGPGTFLPDLVHFVRRVARPAMWIGLARTLIQLTAPGNPDLYQGDELWNFLLVDPDNRRPVDFALRRGLLDGLAARFEQHDERDGLLREMMAGPEDGRIKLHVTWRALEARRWAPALFADAGYEPLTAAGPRAGHVFAFLRRTAGDVDGAAGAGAAAITLVPRLITGAVQSPAYAPPPADWWAGTRLILPPDLPDGPWLSALTGERIALGPRSLDVASALGSLPVALLLGGASV